MSEIETLADLVRERNAVSERITRLIGRPAQIGHLGEWIASKAFDIELEQSAVAKGIDGRFRAGELAGTSVNIKFYAKLENMLAIRADALPDYYLVLTGPRATTLSSRGEARSWYIDYVFLFHADELCRNLSLAGRVKIDPCATSVRRTLWEEAEVYPMQTNSRVTLSEEQRSTLGLFNSQRGKLFG